MNIYVLDTNFFVQAHRVSYPLDVVLSFWNKIRELAKKGKIVSIDKVQQEIYQNEDTLKQWCEENLPPNFFQDTQTVIAQYAEVARWAYVRSEHYTQDALNEFLDADEADAWLVALAKSAPERYTVVTYEKSQPDLKRKIKIPDACNALRLRFIDPIEMFRQLGESF